MNSEHPRITHSRAEALMPAFIHGKLDSGLQRGIQEHIASCQACATRHRQDLELTAALGVSPPALGQILTHDARARNRERLLARIGGHASATQYAAPGDAGRDPRIPGRPHRTAAFTAAVAAVLVLAVWPRSSPPVPVSQMPGFHTRTASAPVSTHYEGSTFRVVFRAQATAENIQRLLLHLDAVVVSGPTAAGVYTLAFPDSTRSGTETLVRLRGQAEIALAEPSVHRDG